MSFTPDPQFHQPTYPPAVGTAWDPRQASTNHADTGAIAWGLGLLIFTFVPFLSSVLASVVMLIVGCRIRSRGPLAAINGTNAANWGLTYLICTLILIPGHFVLLYLMTRDGPVPNFFPLGIPITIWGVITLLHVVFSVIGLARAASEKTFRAPALPFFRV